MELQDGQKQDFLPLKLQPATKSLGADWDDDHVTHDFKPNPIRIRASSNRLQLSSPIIVRSDGVERAIGLRKLDQNSWNRIGGTLRKLGGALLGPIEIFQSMPIKDVPVRICPGSTRSMPVFDELTSSDMIELQLYPAESLRVSAVDATRTAEEDESTETISSVSRLGKFETLVPEWPIDTSDAALLGKKINLLRQTCEGRSPVGVAICVTSTEPTWLTALLEPLLHIVDFITLRMPQSCLPENESCLNYLAQDAFEVIHAVKAITGRHGIPHLSLIVDSAWSDGYQAAQAIMAGADAVVVDQYLIASKPSEKRGFSSNSYESSGMSSLLPPTEYSNIMYRSDANAALEAWDIEGVLTDFCAQLNSARAFCQK